MEIQFRRSLRSVGRTQVDLGLNVAEPCGGPIDLSHRAIATRPACNDSTPTLGRRNERLLERARSGVRDAYERWPSRLTVSLNQRFVARVDCGFAYIFDGHDDGPPTELDPGGIECDELNLVAVF